MLFAGAEMNGRQVETAASDYSNSKLNKVLCALPPEHLPLMVVLDGGLLQT